MPRRFAPFLTIALLAVGACAPTIEQRGHVADEDNLGQIRPGVTSREGVALLLGSPSTTSTFGNDTWYYISRRTRQVAFFKPETTEQRVIAVAFDGSGVVREIRRMGIEDSRDVTPVARATPAPGRELGLLEQLIGNVGKFNPGSQTPRNQSGSPTGL